RGQRQIASCHVGIVGLGGLGSHVAQQLAHLGVVTYTLVDADVVTVSNLNRLIGATSEDAARRTPKVDVVQREIRSLQPTAVIHAIRAVTENPNASDALGRAGIVFGCVDSDEPRVHLTGLCARERKSYVDIATEIAPDGSWYG